VGGKAEEGGGGPTSKFMHMRGNESFLDKIGNDEKERDADPIVKRERNTDKSAGKEIGKKRTSSIYPRTLGKEKNRWEL